MDYLITFLEGIISFISPCMLPMLPLYVSYFSTEAEGRAGVVLRALGFVAGFTLVFCIMGLLAGTVGAGLTGWPFANFLCGLVIIVFGLSYLGIIPMNFLKGVRQAGKIASVFSAFVFGVVYSLNLTPCVGAFLGSALMMAASTGESSKGVSLLFVYSCGLGIPFVLSAMLLDRFRSLFGWVKRNYGIINRISGIFLIVVGIAVASGLSGRLVAFVR